MNRMLTWEELGQQLQALADRYGQLCRVVVSPDPSQPRLQVTQLPSAADLDAVAEEQRIREATSA